MLKESEDSGMVAIPARLILDTLKTFPGQPLTFLKTEKNTIDQFGKYSVAFQNGEFSKIRPD